MALVFEQELLCYALREEMEKVFSLFSTRTASAVSPSCLCRYFASTVSSIERASSAFNLSLLRRLGNESVLIFEGVRYQIRWNQYVALT